MEPGTDPARYEKIRFARDVTGKLHGEWKQNVFEPLVVIASPQFLGDLRAAMPLPF